MKDAALCLVVGFVLGGVFALARLPIPAPPSLAGVCGIVGVTLAFIVVNHYR